LLISQHYSTSGDMKWS